MAAVAFPAAGLAYDHINGVISIPVAHAFNTYFSAMGIPNAANGARDYPIHLLQMLHFSLSRRNPNNIAELDNMFYGAMGIDELSIFQSSQSIAATIRAAANATAACLRMAASTAESVRRS